MARKIAELMARKIAPPSKPIVWGEICVYMTHEGPGRKDLSLDRLKSFFTVNSATVEDLKQAHMKREVVAFLHASGRCTLDMKYVVSIDVLNIVDPPLGAS